MRDLDQIIKSLPEDRQARIETRARILIAEENALRRVRKARRLTQEAVAKSLKTNQAGISKIESRSDMLLSTLRDYIKAMGGSLSLRAEFPDASIELDSLIKAKAISAAKRTVKRRSAVKRKASRAKAA